MAHGIPAHDASSDTASRFRSPTSNRSTQWIERQLIDAARRVLQDSKFASATISLAVVDDATIHELNRQFLNHDWPTDVLSFVLDSETARIWKAKSMLSADTAAAAAAEVGWSPADEQLLYVIHGMLHLVGYRRQSGGRSARNMRAAEAILLAGVRRRDRRVAAPDAGDDGTTSPGGAEGRPLGERRRLVLACDRGPAGELLWRRSARGRCAISRATNWRKSASAGSSSSDSATSSAATNEVALGVEMFGRAGDGAVCGRRRIVWVWQRVVTEPVGVARARWPSSLVLALIAGDRDVWLALVDRAGRRGAVSVSTPGRCWSCG